MWLTLFLHCLCFLHISFKILRLEFWSRLLCLNCCQALQFNEVDILSMKFQSWKRLQRIFQSTLTQCRKSCHSKIKPNNDFFSIIIGSLGTGYFVAKLFSHCSRKYFLLVIDQDEFMTPGNQILKFELTCQLDRWLFGYSVMLSPYRDKLFWWGGASRRIKWCIAEVSN